MSAEYSHQVLKVVVAQICQSLGWNSTQSTPLEILTDVLERYLLEVGKVTHRYAEQFGRTEPTIDDIGLAFRHLQISPGELEEFITNTDPVPYAHDVVAFPAPKKTNLRFPKPDCREVVTRDESIPEYMPLMQPKIEEEEPSICATPNTETGIMGLLQQTNTNTPPASSTEGTTTEKHSLTPPDGPPFKRRRLDSGALPEEAGPSLYEMKSVIISTSGDLTPTGGKAGKLPDPRTPPQGNPKKLKDSPKISPVKARKIFDKEKSDSNKERIERDLFSETVSIHTSYKKASSKENVKIEIVRPKSAVVSPPGYEPKCKSPGQAKSPKGPGRPPGRPPKSPGRPPLKRSPGRPPMQRSPGRPPLSRSPGRSPFQRSPGRPPLHRSPSRPHSGRSPGRPPKSPRGRPRGFIPVVVRPNPTADLEKIERKILENLSPQHQTPSEEVKETTVPDVEPMDLSTTKRSPDDIIEEVVKTEDNEDDSQDGTSKLMIVEHIPKPRGRPPISPEKKLARLANIDDIIQSVIEKSAEKNKVGKPFPPRKDSDDEQEDKIEIAQNSNSLFNEGESFEAYVTNVSLSDLQSDIVSEVTVKTEETDVKDSPDLNKSDVNIVVPIVEKIQNIPPKVPQLVSTPKRKGRPPGSGKKKITPLKEKPKLKQKVLSETISEVNIVDNNPPFVKSEPVKSDIKDSSSSWEAAMSAAGLAVSIRPPEPEEDTNPATADSDIAETVEVGNETVTVKSEPVEVISETVQVTSEPHVVKSEPVGSKDEAKVKDKSEKSEKSKEHKRKKEKKKKNKNKDRDKEKEKSKKDKMYFPKLKIKFGGSSSTCESVIMSPRTESSPNESPRQEGLKMVIKTLPHMSSTESKPSSPSIPSIKKEPKPKATEMKKEPIVKPGLLIEEEPPVLTPEPPKTETPPPPILKAPSPVPHKNPSSLSIPQLPLRIPSPAPPKLSHSSTNAAPSRRHETQDHHPEARKFPSPAPTETKSSPVHTPSTPPSSPPHPPESPVEQVNSPHSDTPSTSPYHSPSPSPGPSNPREKFDLPPMPPPSIVPPPPPPSVKPSVQRTVVAETIGTFIVSEDYGDHILEDSTGQKVWICPTCKMPDDGSPMIGCDICDDWYHWVCVGIKEDPPEDQSWYCSKCLAPTKKSSKRGRKRGSGAGRGRGKKLA